jgi:hypothetical protein
MLNEGNKDGKGRHAEKTKSQLAALQVLARHQLGRGLGNPWKCADFTLPAGAAHTM